MGYTSDVAIRLTTNTKAQMDNLLDTLEVKLYNALKSTFENTDHEHYFYIQKLLDINNNADNEVTLTSFGVKWYEELSDVATVMSWLDDIDESDPNGNGEIAAQFVRIGEDNDDNTDRTYGNPSVIEDWMYISRDISL